MPDMTIHCPACGGAISLDETLAGPFVAETRRTFETQIAAMQSAVAEREAAAARQMIEAAASRAETEEQIAAAVAAERVRIAGAERAAAQAASADEIGTLRRRDAEREVKLAEAQAAQAEAMRKERALEDRAREIELTIQKGVAEQAGDIRAKARAEATEAERLRMAEKDKTIEDMKRQIEDAKRTGERGSQQLQGEVLELSLEAALAARFPHDRIEPVPKGVHGGDVLQHVTTPAGTGCGALLWEVKRTKVWQAAWLPKLRDDQRRAGAAAAVLLSEATPAGLSAFELVDGVWVAHPRLALPLASALRTGLLDLQSLRVAQDGQATKAEMIYAYLTGPRFRARIETVIERFTEMQADLDRERRAMQKLWARRAQQIEAVVGATAGLYGDLQGIAGAAVLDLPALDLPLLENGADTSDGH